MRGRKCESEIPVDKRGPCCQINNHKYHILRSHNTIAKTHHSSQGNKKNICIQVACKKISQEGEDDQQRSFTKLQVRKVEVKQKPRQQTYNIFCWHITCWTRTELDRCIFTKPQKDERESHTDSETRSPNEGIICEKHVHLPKKSRFPFLFFSVVLKKGTGF
jgi:hypothetical protein